MHFIQSLINLAFFLIVVGTVVFSIWLSRKYKERYAVFPWKKAGIIIGIEVIAWIIANAFLNWVERHPWIALIMIAVILIVLVRRKKQENQVF